MKVRAGGSLWAHWAALRVLVCDALSIMGGLGVLPIALGHLEDEGPEAAAMLRGGELLLAPPEG